MTKLTQQQIAAFQKEILDWYSQNKRDLPWRHSRDPYHILLSEVMLQQTQVIRVIPKFTHWMKQFPTMQSLACASARDVLFFWSGLGYNRRALYLKKLAEVLVTQYNGAFPQDEKTLRTLPGIGEYTAKALLCFAFNKQVAVVDTNVKKVILTKFGQNYPEQSEGSHQKKISHSVRNDKQKLPDTLAMTEKEVKQLAEQLLPKGKAYEWNQALMDYASAELKKEKIPIPKQSNFKTSNRFYRGQIVRLLLHRQETLMSLFAKIENNGITKEQFAAIISGMEKDGIVVQKNNTIMLPQE